jgi:predicted TIM-barrel fold metal-dependent hydrolase
MRAMATSEPGEEDAVAILDCHCHAWERWPYLPAVPDEDTRGSVELLLFELDSNGVEQAAIVCAAIDHNADNVEYVSRARGKVKERLHVIADLDCTWHGTYHTPGAPERLGRLADEHELVGFTHYLGERNDGWLRSDEAEAVFALAAQRRLIVSLGAPPEWQADLRPLAARHPSVPVLCHALGVVKAADGLDSPALAEVVASAAVPNIYIKACGFHYSSARPWDHPWPDAVAVFERLFDAYGPKRLCWGSDFPASTRYTTFSAADLRLVLGENLRGLLATGQTGG